MNRFLVTCLFIILLSSCTADEKHVGDTASTACSVSSLSEVFKRPADYLGRKFCGNALAVRDGRTLKLFPVGPIPSNKDHVVLFLDSDADSKIRPKVAHGHILSLYIEGTLSGLKGCLDPVVHSTGCVPFSVPLWVKVSRFHTL